MFCDDLFFDSEDFRTFEAEHKEAMDGAVGADITEASGSCSHHTITLALHLLLDIPLNAGRQHKRLRRLEWPTCPRHSPPFRCSSRSKMTS